MKVEDIIEENDIPEEECECCYLHAEADKKLKDEIICPKCNQPLKEGGVGYYGYVVVGETGCYDKDQDIGKYPIYHCGSCGEEFNELYVLMPIPIIWNANHDIFYTGGNKYLKEDTTELIKLSREKILPLIQHYTKRVYNGEKLTPQNLMTWIEYGIEGIIAEFLYKNGYKK